MGAEPMTSFMREESSRLVERLCHVLWVTFACAGYKLRCRL